MSLYLFCEVVLVTENKLISMVSYFVGNVKSTNNVHPKFYCHKDMEQAAKKYLPGLDVVVNKPIIVR